MSAYYNTIARFYDAEHGDKSDDLMMYSRLAQQYRGKILEVGCGTGRVLTRLAQEGYQAHGIDNNRAMLERLDRKLAGFPYLREHITYDEADVLRHEMKREFSIILLTYNLLMHFRDQDAQLQILNKLRGWIVDNGLLVIDLPNAGEVFATSDSNSLIVDRVFVEPETGHLITLQSLSVLDRTTQLLYVEWFYDEMFEDGSIRRVYVPHTLRYYFYPEMRLLLRQTGFKVMAVYGDTEENPFEEGSERMIIYAQPAR